MGNAAGSKPQIGIKLNHENYFAGSTLAGTIHLHLSQGHSSGGSLTLTVEGEERTCVVESNSGDDEPDVYHRSRRPLIFTTSEVANFNGKSIDPGSYAFPFTFMLPPGLPTTMYCSRGPHHCQVEYLVRAQLRLPGPFSQGGATSSRPFYLSRQPKTDLQYQEPIWVNPAVQKVNFCCCFNRGTMCLGAVVQQGIVERGENMSVSFACKNNSKSRLKGVRIQLLETTRWKANSEHASEVRTLADKYFDELQITGESRDHIPRGDEHRVTQESLKEIYDQLVKGGTETSLLVNPNARDSFVGQLIEVAHSLSIVLCTSIFITSPRLDIPIYVQSSQDASSFSASAAHNSDGHADPISSRPTLVLPEPVPMPEDMSPSAPPPYWEPIVYPEHAIPMNSAILGGRIANRRSTNAQAFTYAPQAPRNVTHDHNLGSSHAQTAANSCANSANVKNDDENKKNNNNSTNPDTPMLLPNSSSSPNPDPGYYWLPEQQTSTSTPSFSSTAAPGGVVVPDPRDQGAAMIRYTRGTLAFLHQELDHTVDHFGTVMRFCEEPSARNTLSSLKPQDLGLIIAKILPEYNQPLGAQMLVRKISNGPSCIHCIAAINAVKGPIRTHVVKQIAPLCHDLRQNRRKIEDQLSNFELLLCKEALYPQCNNNGGSSNAPGEVQIPAKMSGGYVILSPLDQV